MTSDNDEPSPLSEARARIASLSSELDEQRRFDHAVLDCVETGVVTTDTSGRVTFVNRCAADLLHLDSDVTGDPVAKVLALPVGPSLLLGDETRTSFSHPFRTVDGFALDLEVTLSRGSAELGEHAGHFFIFRDVAEEKARKAERMRFERLAAMGTMVAGFAHEIRNPVAAMRSIAEELGEDLRDAGVATPHVGLLLQMVDRIERLVRTSLQFGRPAAPRRAPQRPSVIVTNAITELRARLRALGDEFRVEIEPGLPDLNVDEKQLAQALVILLNNALDATGAASRVTMRVRRGRSTDQESRVRKSEPPPPPFVRLEVVDDGPGIPAEILDRIFDPFFTTKASGTGLGLSIAQQIVSENGARLEVTSPLGSTTFAIIIPIDISAL